MMGIEGGGVHADYLVFILCELGDELAKVAETSFVRQAGTQHFLPIAVGLNGLLFAHTVWYVR